MACTYVVQYIHSRVFIPAVSALQRCSFVLDKPISIIIYKSLDINIIEIVVKVYILFHLHSLLSLEHLHCPSQLSMLDRSSYCGLLSWRPQCLQVCANVRVFTALSAAVIALQVKLLIRTN